MWRLLSLLLVSLGLAPGTWVRSELPVLDHRPLLSVTRLSLPETELEGGLAVSGAWWLRSTNHHFGGYSALLSLGDGTLLAASDRGRMLHITAPGTGALKFSFDYFAGRRQDTKYLVDLEALTRDPATGRMWAAYEGSNQIERLDTGFRNPVGVRPASMRGWPGNAGPEAMVRLRDGRFIVLAETNSDWIASESPGLLFPGDPLEGVPPLQFRFEPPAGFRPVDMAELPDGRVLILLRDVRLGLPPRFVSRLIVADPNEIDESEPWRGETVADLPAGVPTDNYEGLAIDPRGGNTPVVWLISDDNGMKFQRTLLLRLEWRGYAKTRDPGRASR